MTKLLPLALLLAACGGTPGEAADAAPPVDATPPFTVDQPTALVTGVIAPNGIAADERAVYWVENASGDAGGRVRRYDLTTGETTDLAAQGATAQLAIDEDHVYWNTRDSLSIVRVAKDGGATEIVATDPDNINDVAVDGERIYWVTPSTAYSARHDGSDVRELGPSSTVTSDVFVDETRLLWVDSDGTWAVDKDGGTPVQVAATQTGDVITGDDHLFITDRGTHAVIQAGLDGADPTPLAQNVLPGRIAFADGTLYWGNISNSVGVGPGGLWTMVPGSPPSQIVMTDGGATGVAVTRGAVFFTEGTLGGSGAIWATPR